MLDILQRILIGLFGCALIFFPIAYRMMDKIRMHGQMCVRQMDGVLLRWIETAAELVSLDEANPEGIADYASVSAAYRKTKAGKTAEKIRLANEAYELVRKAAVNRYGDVRAKELHAELNEIYADISMLADDYNGNAVKFNEQLDGGFSGLLGKLFCFRKEPILANLTELVC